MIPKEDGAEARVIDSLKHKGIQINAISSLLVPENRLALLSMLNEIPEGEFTFFHSTNSPFSQHYMIGFEIDGVTFNCAEQYMMWSKAIFFGDTKRADDIMKAETPRKQKDIGREVENFNEERWLSVCRDIVYRGNYAKFTQNPDLLEDLIKTEGTLIVELNPGDNRWAIGLGRKNENIGNPKEWKGTNWLGMILTTLREQLSLL